jgi:ribosomal protein L31
MGGRHPPLRATVAAPAPALQSTTITSTTSGSSVTTHTSVTDPITGEVSRVAHAAWTGGRERERERRSPVPGADMGAGWGGEGWSSPSHLRVLQTRVAGRDGASYA